MYGKAMLRMDMGLYIEILFWALLEPMYRIHVLLAVQQILNGAHVASDRDDLK